MHVSRPKLLLIPMLALAACGDDAPQVAHKKPTPFQIPLEPTPPSVAYLEPEGYLETHLTFAWPKQGKVHVTEHRYDRRSRALTEYDIVISEREGNLVLSQKNLEFIRVQGRDARLRVLQAQIAPVKAIGTMLDLEIAPTGYPIGITNLETYIDRATKTLDELAQKASPQEMQNLELVKRGIRSESALKLASGNALQHWNIWVGSFIDLKIATGTSQNMQISNSGIPGYEFPATIEHRGYSRDPREHVHLVREVRIAGKALRAVLHAVLPSIEKELRRDGLVKAATSNARMKNLIYSGTAVMRAEVVTDPATLKPDVVYLHKYIHLVLQPGTAPRTLELERVSWTFDWRK